MLGFLIKLNIKNSWQELILNKKKRFLKIFINQIKSLKIKTFKFKKIKLNPRLNWEQANLPQAQPTAEL